jgi:hypothetical protein
MVHQAIHQFGIRDDDDHGTIFHQIAKRIGVVNDYATFECPKLTS